LRWRKIVVVDPQHHPPKVARAQRSARRTAQELRQEVSMIYHLSRNSSGRGPRDTRARPSESDSPAARARVADLQRGRRGTPEEIALLEAGLLTRG
jgi:Rad3-related DNA helicase